MIQKALNLDFSNKLDCQPTVNLSLLNFLKSAKESCAFMSTYPMIYLAKNTWPNFPAPNFLPISKSSIFNFGVLLSESAVSYHELIISSS